MLVVVLVVELVVSVLVRGELPRRSPAVVPEAGIDVASRQHLLSRSALLLSCSPALLILLARLPLNCWNSGTNLSRPPLKV